MKINHILLGLIIAGTTAAIAAEAKSDKGFIEQVERWQDKMSEAFRDTWKNLRGDAHQSSLATASVDLREQDKSYTVRLNLPDRDLASVSITLEGDTLHIVAPAGGSFGRYEQTLALTGVAPDAKLSVKRTQKDGLIVVTIPKIPPVAKGPTTMPDSSRLPLSNWDRDILGRMDRMRREMDRIFSESFDEFRLTPEHMDYFDKPSFGSSVDLKEEGSNYVVTAYLPERDMQNVSATVEDRLLKIEAKAESAEGTPKDAARPSVTRKAQYQQVLTLPGPVQVDKMKLERKEGILTITLPKA